MGAAARADPVDALGAALERLADLVRVKHLVADDVVDLIEHYQIVLAAVNGFAAGLPAFAAEFDVFGVGLCAADFDEAAAHRADFKLVVAEEFGGVELAVVPRAFNELNHEDAESLADGAEGGAQGAGGLSFARAGINDEQSFSFRHVQLSVKQRRGGRKRVCGLPRERSSERGAVRPGGWTSAERLDSKLGELEAVNKRVSERGEALAGGRGEGLRRGGVRVVEEHPQARAAGLISGGGGARGRGDFQGPAPGKAEEGAAGGVPAGAGSPADGSPD